MTDRPIYPFPVPDKKKRLTPERKVLLEKLMTEMEALRQKIDPSVLERIRNLATEVPHVSAAKNDTVPVDKERNIRTVMKFLDMPEGAKLRDQLFPNG
jgi:hypothetical protein